MRARCEKPHNRDWKDYGERGIVVCDRWQSFESFLADMGERPDGTSIDRFPDTNGNYEPGNCRWATQAQQQRNRRDTKIREDDLPAVLAMRTAGESTYAIARRFGVDQSTARCAIRAARAIATHEDSHE